MEPHWQVTRIGEALKLMAAPAAEQQRLEVNPNDFMAMDVRRSLRVPDGQCPGSDHPVAETAARDDRRDPRCPRRGDGWILGEGAPRHASGLGIGADDSP